MLEIVIFIILFIISFWFGYKLGQMQVNLLKEKLSECQDKYLIRQREILDQVIEIQKWKDLYEGVVAMNKLEKAVEKSKSSKRKKKA